MVIPHDQALVVVGLLFFEWVLQRSWIVRLRWVRMALVEVVRGLYPPLLASQSVFEGLAQLLVVRCVTCAVSVSPVGKEWFLGLFIALIGLEKRERLN